MTVCCRTGKELFWDEKVKFDVYEYDSKIWRRKNSFFWSSMFCRANGGLCWSRWCWKSTAMVESQQTGEAAKYCDQNSLTLFWSHWTHLKTQEKPTKKYRKPANRSGYKVVWSQFSHKLWSQLVIICHNDHISPTTLLMLWYPSPQSQAQVNTGLREPVFNVDNANISHTPGCFCNPMLLDFDDVQRPNSRVVPTQCLQCLQLFAPTVCFNEEATFTYTHARAYNGYCRNRDGAVSNTIFGSVCCSSDKYRFTYSFLVWFSLLLLLPVSLNVLENWAKAIYWVCCCATFNATVDITALKVFFDQPKGDEFWWVDWEMGIICNLPAKESIL